MFSGVGNCEIAPRRAGSGRKPSASTMNPPNGTDDSAKITLRGLREILCSFARDVFYDSTCVGDVVEHIRDSSAEIITGVSDAHGESDVLESAKRCRESRESGRFFIERDLMIALECVDNGKEPHTFRDGAHGLERGGRLKAWADDFVI
ncbi:hypothetical protein OUZ56_032054 [Daphnia magna]|uniref:Uncharacterized protein n=1 Tax=Daphnia magna TaxID=35525 RepID=A0ABQ9Z4B2_9CRUS|nr:hypothetical protein OUZ56_012881 [Daphnia magna]KAK4017100.1 hypothetical protein OUZ56_032054 [Daphnia magna]